MHILKRPLEGEICTEISAITLMSGLQIKSSTKSFFFKTNCLRSGDVINRILFYRESLMSIFCENENHLKRWICRRKRWFGETFDELMKRRRWFENHLIWRQLLSKKSRIPIWKYPTLFYKWYVPKRRTIIFQIYVYMIKIEGNWH